VNEKCKKGKVLLRFTLGVHSQQLLQTTPHETLSSPMLRKHSRKVEMNSLVDQQVQSQQQQQTMDKQQPNVEPEHKQQDDSDQF